MQHLGLKSEETITIRRLMQAPEVTRRDLLRAIRLAAGDRPIRSLSIVLAPDKVIAELHGQFMNDPTPTDVLTFDLREDPVETDPAGPIEGEIIVSLETARREARRRRLRDVDEVLRYVIHGTLHLVGYDDVTPALRRRMRREEDRVLASLAEAGKASRHPAISGRPEVGRVARSAKAVRHANK